jgi:predicted CXXCH cytochrome family protein
MRARLSHFLVFAVLLASAFPGLLLGAGATIAAESEQTGRAVGPSPPKGKGDKCVADTDYMRRYHMTMLDHQRDGTVHEGIRTKQFSLKECIACHAVQGPDARPVTIKSPKHFCRGCHDYAAVKVDCFECHASRPDPGKAARLPSNHDAQEVNALAGYLGGKRQ